MPTPPTFTVGQLLTSAQMNTISALLCPTGSVLPFAGSTAPTNFLLCAGQTVSRTTYADLFAVCGTLYNTGGEAGTDFRLPDLRGRVPAGLDNMGGTAAGRLTSAVLTLSNTLGATGGEQTVTLSSAQMPTHTHVQDGHSHGVQRSNSAATSVGTDASALYRPQANTGGGYFDTQVSTATNQNTGGGGAHSNTQPTLVLSYIIKI
jgi:microcystin-dependent protein